MPSASQRSVVVHSLERRHSQAPFKKKNLDIRRVAFHPRLPLFFVATKTHVRVYNLREQSLVKKLVTGMKWISSLAIHPQG